VAREGRIGILDGAGRTDGGGQAVVDEQVKGHGPAAAEDAGATQERTGDGQAGQGDHQAARGQEQELLQAQATALLLVRLQEEPHRRPHHRPTAAAHEDVNQDRDGDPGDSGGGEDGVEEGHGRGTKARRHEGTK
jgi:hypothetical protein